MLLLLCAIVLVSAASDRPARYDLEDAEQHFQNFIEEHHKTYASEYEKQFRFEIFKQNLERINQLNEESEHTVYGVTQFSDLTLEEFQLQYTGLKDIDDIFETEYHVITDDDIHYNDAPESFDWREHNAVTRVKNQGCNDCYAFSAIGNIEGQFAIQHKKLVEFSEQQIVDCDNSSSGCGGGLIMFALQSVIERGGIESTEDYPYAGKAGTCNFNASKVTAELSGYINYNLVSQETLKQVLYHNGPIAIGVRGDSIQHYKNGIMDDKDCDHGYINHAVLLVGYGSTEQGVPYWIVKNSWGTTFGEDGYFRTHRGENYHSCGMMNDMMATALVE